MTKGKEGGIKKGEGKKEKKDNEREILIGLS